MSSDHPVGRYVDVDLGLVAELVEECRDHPLPLARSMGGALSM